MNARWKLVCRCISLTLITVLTLDVAACTAKKVRQVLPDQVDVATTEKVVGVTTIDGRQVRFDPNRRVELRRTGTGPQGLVLEAVVMGQRFETTMDRVQRVWVERREKSTVRTVGLVAGLAAAAVVTIVAVNAANKPDPAPPVTPPQTSSQSCPFVYSWDGTEFVFDAEPYGGATTRGLERDDVSELEHLVSADGEYRLLMTNEQDETQFSNLIELQVVDHPLGTRVVADNEGHFHTVGNPQAALRAWDRAGHDLSSWLLANDHQIWEPSAAVDSSGNVREEINLVFRKPAGARQAKLVANAGTGLWGSHMIKSLLQLRGRELPLLYKELDINPLSVDLLGSWVVREDLFALNVFLAETSGWVSAGMLPGGGPYRVEDRVINLDLSDSADEEIRLQLRPPSGFWAINSMALDFSGDENIRVRTVSPFEARDEAGRDVRPLLNRSDSKYYEMPRIGNHAALRFHAPPPVAGMRRTVFLHSRGYYKLHLDGQGEPQTTILEELENMPDAAARLAAAQYAEWQRTAN